MRLITGQALNETPLIKVSLSGDSSKQPTEFTAVVDTGFSGFVSIPILQALRIGVQPSPATAFVTLADGKTQVRTLGDIWVTIDNQKEGELAILEPTSTEILIGMDFLRAFKLALFVTSASVVLIDEGAFAQFVLPQLPLGSPTSTPPPSPASP